MGELIEQLGLDGGAFLAQIVNFTILALILWRFTYKPVIKLLEERRARIKKSIADAAAIEQERKNTEKVTRKKIMQAEEEGKGLVDEAKRSAEKVLHQARQDALEEQEKIIDQGQVALNNRKNEAEKELHDDLAGLVVKVTEKVVQESMDKDQQEKLAKQVIEKL